MIEQIMYFVLGLLASALVTIALLPALWRRAVRLTRARLEASLPLTPEEIAAEKDQLRAIHSVEIRRLETRADEVENALQAAKTDIGAKTTIIQAHESTIASHVLSIEALRSELADKREIITARDQTIGELERERDNLATNLGASRISNHALDQETINLRQLADQRQARLSEMETQVDSLNARLIDALAVSAGQKEEIQGKNDELRLAARNLREAATHIAALERKATAAETMASDRQATIDTLQEERLRLIDEAGQLTRERDHERVERHGIAAHVEQLNARLADAQAGAAATRERTDDLVRDLTRTVEGLRREKRKVEDELSTLRLEKAGGEAEILRLRRSLAFATADAEAARAEAAPAPAEHAEAATADQPRPT